MRTSGYVVIITILLLSVLVFVPNSPLYFPFIRYLERHIEKEWRCEIITKKADINMLKGMLTLRGLYIKTAQASNPTWNLNVKHAVIQISYPSLIKRTTVLDAVILDHVTFVQDTKERPPTKNGQAPETPKTDDRTSDKEDGREDQQKKQALIKRLVIQNGTFEFNYEHVSGKKQSLRAEHVNLVKKNVIFDRHMNTFFRSFFETRNRLL